MPELTYAVRAATTELVQGRELTTPELRLYELLEAWEEAGWDDRVAVVDALRRACRALL